MLVMTIGINNLGQGIWQEHQVDQGGGTYPKGGMTFNEPGWGQLHTDPHKRPISCHVTSLPCQELEEKLNKLLLTKVSDRDWDVKVKKCQVEMWVNVYVIVSYRIHYKAEVLQLASQHLQYIRVCSQYRQQFDITADEYLLMTLTTAKLQHVTVCSADNTPRP